MSKMIKCDNCGNTIDFSKRQTLERIEVDGIGFTVNIEVLNKYQIHQIRRPASSGVPYWPRGPTPLNKDDNLDLCPNCFAKVITALKAHLNR